MITSKPLSPNSLRILRFCAAFGAVAILPFGVASGQDHKAVEKRLQSAVENGEISAAQAKVMMAALQKSAAAEKTPVKKPEAGRKKAEVTKKKPEVAKKQPEVTKKKPVTAKKVPSTDFGAAWAKLTALVDEGQMTKKEAIAKMAALKKQAASKKDPAAKNEAASKKGTKKKPEGDHEAIARKLKAAVAAGELTPEQAKAKFAAIQKQAAAQKKDRVKK